MSSAICFNFNPWFEILIHLLVKCERKLENVSKIFKHLRKNVSANYRWSTTRMQ